MTKSKDKKKRDKKPRYEMQGYIDFDNGVVAVRDTAKGKGRRK